MCNLRRGAAASTSEEALIDGSMVWHRSVGTALDRSPSYTLRASRSFPNATPATFIASPLVAPAPPSAAADQAGAHPLFQEGRRPEALAIGLVEDFRGLQAELRGGRVHQLERPHRVAEPELAGGVDVFGRGNAVLDEAHRLVEEDEEHAVDRKAGDVLDG